MLLDERGFVDHKSIITFYLNQGSESARADKEIACHGLISTTLRVYICFPNLSWKTIQSIAQWNLDIMKGQGTGKICLL